MTFPNSCKLYVAHGVLYCEFRFPRIPMLALKRLCTCCFERGKLGRVSAVSLGYNDVPPSKKKKGRYMRSVTTIYPKYTYYDVMPCAALCVYMDTPYKHVRPCVYVLLYAGAREAHALTHHTSHVHVRVCTCTWAYVAVLYAGALRWHVFHRRMLCHLPSRHASTDVPYNILQWQC